MTTRCILGLAALAAMAAVWCGDRPASAEPAQQSCRKATTNSKVNDAFRLERNQEPEQAKSSPVRTVELKDKIAVEVTPNLEALYEPPCNKDNIVLYLDGRALKSVKPIAPNPDGKFLTFELRRTEDSRQAWDAILGKPDFDFRTVKVSVGFEGEFALLGVGNKLPELRLKVIPHWWFLLWCLIFFVVALIFLRLVHSSSVIRDRLPRDRTPPAGGEASAKGTFSLSKSQGALWFFVIVAAYLFIGIVTGDFSDSINSTALILLGIGAGTVVGSAVIDVSKNTPEALEAEAAQADEAKADVDDLQLRLKAKEARSKDDPDPDNTASRADLLAQKERKHSLHLKLTGQSESFLRDILSDANGVNFHRFQMAAWTFVLAIIFIKEVYENLAMPTFNTTLLGLLGLSAGTYLGMKIPEPTRAPDHKPSPEHKP
jgi:hypothetical protein